MSMIKVDVSKLEGTALDWAVAKAEGVNAIMFSPRKDEPRKPMALFGSLMLSIGGEDAQHSYSPSRCWHCGGPLIEKHIEQVEQMRDGRWCADTIKNDDYRFGDTLLIAVCRAIVAAKLGDTVEVPAELVEVKP